MVQVSEWGEGMRHRAQPRKAVPAAPLYHRPLRDLCLEVGYPNYSAFLRLNPEVREAHAEERERYSWESFLQRWES